MESDFRRILIVSHDGANTQSLLDAVAQRAEAFPTDFTLLVPAVAHGLHRVVDPEDQCCGEAEARLDAALPALSEAAGTPITGIVGGHDPFAAAWDALNAGAYDEVIVSTPPSRLGRWLRVDLEHKIARLGVPVTTIPAEPARVRPPGGRSEALASPV